MKTPKHLKIISGLSKANSSTELSEHLTIHKRGYAYALCNRLQIIPTRFEVVGLIGYGDDNNNYDAVQAWLFQNLQTIDKETILKHELLDFLVSKLREELLASIEQNDGIYVHY